MTVDTNFFAATMRYQTLHGFCTDEHAVVSCIECHQLMLAQNLLVHMAGHTSGGVMDATMHLRITGDRKVFHAVSGAPKGWDVV